MRAFVAVVEAGGPSAAARRLHISQPALSQTISGLEKQFGVELLVRSSAGVSVTPAGMTLLGEVRDLIARHDHLEAAMGKYSPGNGSLLRIGIPLELPPDTLSPGLAVLATEFPATQVQVRHLSTAEQTAALRSRELDLALVRERPAAPDVDVLLVVEEYLGVLLAVDEAIKREVPEGIRLESLIGLQWLGFPRDGSPGLVRRVDGDHAQPRNRRRAGELAPGKPDRGNQGAGHQCRGQIRAGSCQLFDPDS
ncbi:MAG: LysR family transcriptional regulator [Mycobacterium sp.]|nr:LysR family transcriptional regulator [Mycobacterium sp.]